MLNPGKLIIKNSLENNTTSGEFYTNQSNNYLFLLQCSCEEIKIPSWPIMHQLKTMRNSN